tara:strand:- start:21 stop:566 length:546 start_codon:yes stop_codon:yes gene_type:complete
MKKIKEIGIGAFRPDTSVSGKHLSSLGHTSPRSGADSHYSRYSQRTVPLDYFDIDDDEDEEIILDCRVYKNGKYCLIETLERVDEFDYSDKINAMMVKLSRQKQKRDSEVDDLPDLKDKIDEFSGSAAVGGAPAVPVGYTAKGKPETPSQRRKRQKFNITKSYPYNRLANPPQSRKKRRKK